MRTLILAVIAALSLNVAQAVEVAGVKFEDTTSLGNTSLVANGAGMRKKAFFKVYAMALYLPGKQADAEGVLSAKGAKRIASRCCAISPPNNSSMPCRKASPATIPRAKWPRSRNG